MLQSPDCRAVTTLGSSDSQSWKKAVGPARQTLRRLLLPCLRAWSPQGAEVTANLVLLSFQSLCRAWCDCTSELSALAFSSTDTGTELSVSCKGKEGHLRSGYSIGKLNSNMQFTSLYPCLLHSPMQCNWILENQDLLRRGYNEKAELLLQAILEAQLVFKNPHKVSGRVSD